jgi:hypothetical protein
MSRIFSKKHKEEEFEFKKYECWNCKSRTLEVGYIIRIILHPKVGNRVVYFCNNCLVPIGMRFKKEQKVLSTEDIIFTDVTQKNLKTFFK